MDSFESEAVIKRIQANGDVLDVLINIEDFFDSLHLYTFRNWIDGEVVAGPEVTRYWVSVTLKYPHHMMPEPIGGMRLVSHDCHVRYRLARERKRKTTQTASDVTASVDPYSRFHYRPSLTQTRVWLVTIEIPRRFIDEIRDEALDQYDVSIDDIEDADDDSLETPPEADTAPAVDAAPLPEPEQPTPEATG